MHICIDCCCEQNHSLSLSLLSDNYSVSFYGCNIAVDCLVATIHFYASKTMREWLHDGHYVSLIHHSNGLWTVRKSTLVCTHELKLHVKNSADKEHFVVVSIFNFYSLQHSTDIEPVISFSARKWMSNAEMSGEICKPHIAKLIDFPNGFAWIYEQFMQYFIWIYSMHHIASW